jgi:hypothetical protein
MLLRLGTKEKEKNFEKESSLDELLEVALNLGVQSKNVLPAKANKFYLKITNFNPTSLLSLHLIDFDSSIDIDLGLTSSQISIITFEGFIFTTNQTNQSLFSPLMNSTQGSLKSLLSSEFFLKKIKDEYECGCHS